MQDAVNEVTSCEVCGNESIRKVLDLGLHPMCDDLVAIGESRECIEYPIEIMYCDRCITAHQRFQIPKQKLFPTTYHYRSRHTADVINGMRQLVSSCVEMSGSLEEKKVLDIGCNDGSLLSFFKEYGATTFGIEPTDAVNDALESGHVAVQAFLTEEIAEEFVRNHGHPDIITFTNVFAHIEDLQSVIRSLKLLSYSRTMIVIENHYLGSVLEKNQFDTFYHEHPRTYSYTSFAHIADSMGMTIAQVDFPKRYGGNIRIYLTYADQNTGHHRWDELNVAERAFGSGFESLSLSIQNWRVKKIAEISAEVKKYGKLPAKAFPGRAAILIKILGIDENSISAVYEKSASGKIGHYVPGTRIPIRSDNDFVASEAPLLNLAWHISDEIKTYMKSLGYSGRVIDIISPTDF
jgi:SAM-dependent methyltransferase